MFAELKILFKKNIHEIIESFGLDEISMISKSNHKPNTGAIYVSLLQPFKIINFSPHDSAVCASFS